jgi:hypothetical protein
MYDPISGASSAPEDGLRYAVVQHLQEQLANARPGSHAYEVADRAITLALSPRRNPAVPEYLERNVRRDARRILARSQRRVITDPMTPDTALGREIEAGLHPAAVDRRHNPEQSCSVSDLQTKLERRVGAHLGTRGLRCLAGLLAGESPRETAAALGSAPRTVDRLRAKVREIARRFLQSQEA